MAECHRDESQAGRMLPQRQIHAAFTVSTTWETHSQTESPIPESLNPTFPLHIGPSVWGTKAATVVTLCHFFFKSHNKFFYNARIKWGSKSLLHCSVLFLFMGPGGTEINGSNYDGIGILSLPLFQLAVQATKSCRHATPTVWKLGFC